MRFFVTGFALLFLFAGALLSPGFALSALDAPEPVYPIKKSSPVWKGQIEFKWTSTGAPFYMYSLDNQTTGEQKTWVGSSLSNIQYDLNVGD
ncbi:MAG: hypothetical protein O3C23_01795, partial [bacterium]|nr:hypothetical protein [bacterium]